MALVFGLFCYLGLYTWNARTGYLDTVAENSGLEVVSFLLSPLVWVKDQASIGWNHYLALVSIAEENTRLRNELQRSLTTASLAEEDRQELMRLRNLFQLPQLQQQPGFAARVLARRFGPNSPLQTITINKGFTHGATVGTPVVIPGGVVGQVLRSAPHASTVLLLTDPSFRLAVVSQKTRTPAIAVGTGPLSDEFQIDVTYVAPNAKLEVGELLVATHIEHKADCVLSVGDYHLFTIENEPNISDNMHLELEVGRNIWQGYLLLTGLPDVDKTRVRIIPTKEIITGNPDFAHIKSLV